MAKRSGKKKRPASDPNVSAFDAIRQQTERLTAPLHLVTNEDQAETPPKNPAAVALGRMGGKKGGPARAKKLSRAKLSAIGKKGAEARWGPKKG